MSADNFNQSFKSNTSMTEEKFKMDTVGLVTYEDFKKKREGVDLVFQSVRWIPSYDGVTPCPCVSLLD